MNESDMTQLAIEVEEEKRRADLGARYSSLISKKIARNTTLQDALIERQMDTVLMQAIVSWCDDGVYRDDEWLRIKELRETASLYL